ncbi:MAG: iron-containing alcohol dehydrogenase [Caldimonas sp.]
MANLIGDMARSFGLPPLKRAAGVVTRRLPIRQPMLIVGAGASVRLAATLGTFGYRKLLVVTDAPIRRLGLLTPMTDALAAAGAAFVVFDEVTQDAPIPEIERGIALFRAEACDAIVAFGGGSVMDTAKTIGLAAANDKHPRELAGYFKGRHGPVPIYAVPTTAGTGSEVTVAAVVSDPADHAKLLIADTRIVPQIAALDPCLMTGLPADVTAATGMDALTHAIEAYIGQWSTEFTDRMALAAVAMIYRSLPAAFADGKDLVAREQMAVAATFAGLAFTRANVGNVHAIAHQLGGRYQTPHGLANAIMLAPVLRFSAPVIEAKLAVLARRAGVGAAGDGEAELARKFLDSVEALNRSLAIPRQLDALREEDIPGLARAACHEADTNYPVPRVMSRDECESLLREVSPGRPEPRPDAPGKSTAAKAPAREAAARKTASRKVLELRTPARKAPARKAPAR